jgi:hypothetical protein
LKLSNPFTNLSQNNGNYRGSKRPSNLYTITNQLAQAHSPQLNFSSLSQSCSKVLKYQATCLIHSHERPHIDLKSHQTYLVTPLNLRLHHHKRTRRRYSHLSQCTSHSKPLFNHSRCTSLNSTRLSLYFNPLSNNTNHNTIQPSFHSSPNEASHQIYRTDRSQIKKRNTCKNGSKQLRTKRIERSKKSCRS